MRAGHVVVTVLAVTMLVTTSGAPSWAGPGCTIVGTNSDDILPGTENPDVLCAKDGSDFTNGLGGADTVRGGPAADAVIGGDGVDVVLGGRGDGTMWGDLSGVAPGADTMRGGPGDDVLHAEDDEAADTLIDGGLGTNDVCYVDATDPAPVNCETVILGPA